MNLYFDFLRIKFDSCSRCHFNRRISLVAAWIDVPMALHSTRILQLKFWWSRWTYSRERQTMNKLMEHRWCYGRYFATVLQEHEWLLHKLLDCWQLDRVIERTLRQTFEGYVRLRRSKPTGQDRDLHQYLQENVHHLLVWRSYPSNQTILWSIQTLLL